MAGGLLRAETGRAGHLFRFWAAVPLLAPVALWQGLRTRRSAPRLPPVLDDVATGTVGGEGPVERLLVVGESTAVGVGATRPEAALAPQLAKTLSARRGTTVRWQVVGQNGIRAAGLGAKLAARSDLLAAHWALVLLGANDVSGLTAVRRWTHDLDAVVRRLQAAGATVLVAPVPPFHLFHLLPQPLRWLLGERAGLLCSARHTLAGRDGVHVLETEFPRERRYLAADGYHPSDLAYYEWADQIAEFIENLALGDFPEKNSSPDPSGPADR
ncbi:MAG: SGNH/GDSL hydrolase family protein [Gammaproteobacteria bacterium]|jgi:lysophospholipase L1-like esterase